MTTWFTSDHHFGHFKILGFCNRPFKDLDQMHRVMQERWNEVVSPTDTVWVLGDFAFGPSTFGAEILNTLAGSKHLVQGNHDRHRPSRYRSMGFDSVQTHAMIELGGQTIRMRHRPPEHPEEPQLTLCGHVHDRWAWDPQRLTLNVGVDLWGFQPISELQVVETLVKAREPAWAAAHLKLYTPMI